MTEQEEFEIFKDLFNTQGWHLLLGYLESDADTIANCRYLKDEKELYFTRGKLAVLDDIINFEAKLDAAYEASE